MISLITISCIAAAFVAGYFLLHTTHNPKSEGMGNVVSMNTEKHEVLRTDNPSDSIEEGIEPEKLLAKHEPKEKKEENHNLYKTKIFNP